MKGLIILGAIICIVGFVLFAMPNVWTDVSRVVTDNTTQTSLKVISFPKWLGPGSIALGIVFMLIGSIGLRRTY